MAPDSDPEKVWVWCDGKRQMLGMAMAACNVQARYGVYRQGLQRLQHMDESQVAVGLRWSTEMRLSGHPAYTCTASGVRWRQGRSRLQLQPAVHRMGQVGFATCCPR